MPSMMTDDGQDDLADAEMDDDTPMQDEQIFNATRQRPRLNRRSSSMLDLMKYSMARANEIPSGKAARSIVEEAWKAGRDTAVDQPALNKRTAEWNEASQPGQDLPRKVGNAQQVRASSPITMTVPRPGLARTRYDTEPPSVSSFVNGQLSRCSTWVSNLSDHSSSMDHSSFDSVDGLFSRNGVMVIPYEPVRAHWYFCRKEEGKDVWVPFTIYDAAQLEETFHRYRRGDHSSPLVATQGGRYDVDIKERKLMAVYWDEEPFPVRRGTWFWKHAGEVYYPYEESVAEKLEGEYRLICKTGEWQKRIDLPGGETIILHSETAMIHYDATKSWTDVAETLYKNQKIVKRGWEGTCTPEEGEWEPVDHVVFVSHGIGSYCDLKWRTLNQCVDAYRLMSRNLLRDHFNFAGKKGKSFRVEFIPINWHGIIHSDNLELENRIKRITLSSIPIVRYFANDYVLDILFYSSPMYCKIIADHVGADMNRLYSLFRQRNPEFRGGMSIVGHSLGSIVLFDMLSHQPNPCPNGAGRKPDADFKKISTDLEFDNELSGCQDTLGVPRGNQYTRQSSTNFQNADYVVPPFMGAGYPSIRYPVLTFKPSCFFAMGSPIGMFLAVRGVTHIAQDYSLPTCPKFFNIFHPNDPVAYRIEPLLMPEACKVPALMIEHHKGRQRLHLEVTKNVAAVASSLKTRLMDPMRLLTSYIAMPSFVKKLSAHAAQSLTEQQPGINVTAQTEAAVENAKKADPRAQLGPSAPTPSGGKANGELPKIRHGLLNGGDRIDHVLQEAPFESLNQYLFAMNSHACYWDSEDTLLFMLRRIIDIERDSFTVSAEESEEEEHQYI